VIDSDPLSHERLDKDQLTTWEDAGGRFTVGAALEIDALLSAGIERADVFLAATSGDNTNLVISQIAKQRFHVQRVVVRVADPGRAAWYAEQGLHTICPTQEAIEQASRAALAA
jgi:trk system potassium uptake protein TrkA